MKMTGQALQMSSLNIFNQKITKEMLRDLKDLYNLNGVTEAKTICKNYMESVLADFNVKYDGYQISLIEIVDGVSQSRILTESELNSLEAEIDLLQPDPEAGKRLVEAFKNKNKD